MNAQVQMKLVNSVSTKKETAQLWSRVMDTSWREDARANATSVPAPQTSQSLDIQHS